MPFKMCGKGHYYNTDQHSTCPTCAEEAVGGTIGTDFEPNPSGGFSDDRPKTKIFPKFSRGGADRLFNAGEAVGTDGYYGERDRGTALFVRGGEHESRHGETASEQPAGTTVRLGDAAGGSRRMPVDTLLPAVGWLVVVNTAGAGRDFRLVPGQNCIGRDSDMQICLDFGPDSDTTVSRREHAVIAYDSIDNEFFISDRTKSPNLPRLNGKGIRSSTTLKAMDIIQVGETQLMFIPLCGETFQWGAGEKLKQ